MFKCDFFFSLAFGSSTEVWVHHGVGPRPRWGAVGIAWKGRLPEAAADTNPPRHVLLLILSPSLSGGGKVMKVTARSWCWSCFLMERHSLVLSPGTAGVLSQTSLVPPPNQPLPCWEETDSQLALAVLTIFVVTKAISASAAEKPRVCSGCFYSWNQVPGSASGDVLGTCAAVFVFKLHYRQVSEDQSHLLARLYKTNGGVWLTRDFLRALNIISCPKGRGPVC